MAPLRLRLGLIACSLALTAMVVAMTSDATAQAAGSDSEVAEKLGQAMRVRIAVSYNQKSGKTIPAYHCRHAPGGCEARLSTFAQYLVEAGSQHGVDPWLMAAMAFKESGFNPFALGSLGEMGILQINPTRKDAMNVRFIRDEWYRRRCRKEPGACQREVVHHAAQLIGRAMGKCGRDMKEALGMYNTGRCGGNKTYAKGILEVRDELLKAAGVLPGEPVEVAAGG